MDDVTSQMIELIIQNTKNEDVRKGLQMALDVTEEAGYIPLDDWENMSKEERIDVIQSYIE